MNALMWEWISQNTRTTPGRSKRTDLEDRKSTRLNSSHSSISYAVFCLKKKMEISVEAKTDKPDPIVPVFVILAASTTAQPLSTAQSHTSMSTLDALKLLASD